VLAAVLLSCLSCTKGPRAPAYSAAEVDQALQGVKSLQARCYASSPAARARRVTTLDFSLQIAATGQVQAIPTNASPEEPALIECLRHGLNEVRFPARARDRLDLHLELTAPQPGANAVGEVANHSPIY
jgi:hypothetical protein